jgi:hypothetical protein
MKKHIAFTLLCCFALTAFAACTEKPERVDTLTVNGKEYSGSYYGKENLQGIIEGFQYREFWRLEDAYADAQNNMTVNSMLPYNSYPMTVEPGQVFVIHYLLADGTERTEYHRSDKGTVFSTGTTALPATIEFTWDAPKPERVDVLTIDGKEYECSYFGKIDLRGSSLEAYGYAEREFWRVEGAYDEVSSNAVSSYNAVLPYNNYPLVIEPRQVFRIRYLHTDGTEHTEYYRSDDGYIWNELPSTVGFEWE